MKALSALKCLAEMAWLMFTFCILWAIAFGFAVIITVWGIFRPAVLCMDAIPDSFEKILAVPYLCVLDFQKREAPDHTERPGA